MLTDLCSHLSPQFTIKYIQHVCFHIHSPGAMDSPVTCRVRWTLIICISKEITEEGVNFDSLTRDEQRRVKTVVRLAEAVEHCLIRVQSNQRKLSYLCLWSGLMTHSQGFLEQCELRCGRYNTRKKYPHIALVDSFKRQWFWKSFLWGTLVFSPLCFPAFP